MLLQEETTRVGFSRRLVTLSRALKSITSKIVLPTDCDTLNVCMYPPLECVYVSPPSSRCPYALARRCREVLVETSSFHRFRKGRKAHAMLCITRTSKIYPLKNRTKRALFVDYLLCVPETKNKPKFFIRSPLNP